MHRKHSNSRRTSVADTSVHPLLSGAGVGFEPDRNDRRMWALHAGFLALEVSPTVPSTVLAEAWRGGSRQTSLTRFLALCTTEPLTEERAKAVGALAARADHDDVVDVTVVEGALRRRDAIVTSNPTHIRKITDAARTRLTIETV